MSDAKSAFLKYFKSNPNATKIKIGVGLTAGVFVIWKYFSIKNSQKGKNSNDGTESDLSQLQTPPFYGTPFIHFIYDSIISLIRNDWATEIFKVKGDIFMCYRLFTNTVVCVWKPKHIKEILAIERRLCLESSAPTVFKCLWGETSILELSGIEHQKMRSLILKVLGPVPLRRTLPHTVRIIQEHFNSWCELSGNMKELEVSPLCEKLSSLLLIGLITGEHISKEDTEWVRIRAAYILQAALSSPVPIEIPGTSFAQGMHYRRELIEWVNAQIERTLRSDITLETSTSLIDKITLENECRAPEDRYNRTEIIDQILIFLIGGNDTLKQALSNMFSILIDPQHQTHVEILREKLFECVFGDGSYDRQQIQELDFNFESVLKCQYLTYFYKEVMRFITVAALFGHDFSTRDVQIGDYRIPKGTMINVSLETLHHDPSLWKNPYEFEPLRFEKMDNQKSRDVNDRYRFLPYFFGHRQCPGMYFAEQSLKMFAALYVLSDYRGELCSNIERKTFLTQGSYFKFKM